MATTFNVDNFKSAIADGGARPNQFMFQLSFPTYVNGAEAVSKSPFLVSVAELPGQTVNPAIVQYRGREVKFAGDRVYSPYTITLLTRSLLICHQLRLTLVRMTRYPHSR